MNKSILKQSKNLKGKKNFIDLLHNKFSSPFDLASFERYAKTQFSEENVEFWLAVDQFRHNTAPNHRETYGREVEHIWNTYLYDHAMKTVNINYKTKMTLKKKLTQLISSVSFFFLLLL